MEITVERRPKKINETVILKCNFCGKQFKKTFTRIVTEVKCPKCGEYDCEPA